MKKIISLLLCIIMILSLSLTANALTEGDWEYKILDNEVTITRYNGNDTYVIVPETIRGCPVVKIQINDMYSTQNIVTLILPNTLKELGDGAFWRSENLKHVTMPHSLKKIGKQAFAQCISLETIDLSYVETIGEAAFADCSVLSNVILSDKLSIIADHAFQNTNINHIDIPNSVKRIGVCAFAGTTFKSIIIPGTVETIDHDAFYSCRELKSVIISYGVRSLAYSRYYPSKTFSECPKLEEIYIPDTITNLDETFLYGHNNPNDAIVYCSAKSPVIDICKKIERSYIIDNSVNTKINVLYNGNRISFHKYEQNPELIDNRTMVPLRSIFEAMGATVAWDNNTQTAIATRGNTKVEIQINSNTMYVNSAAKKLDVPAMLLNSRTMVPVRAVSEAFGCKVEWDQNTQTVLITQ